MIELRLYHTSHCHLCEMADSLLGQLLNPEYFRLEKHDIAFDDGLIERYGVRIPVLQRVADGAELGWPFDVDDVIAFLSDTLPEPG